MKYRKLDENGDMTFGSGLDDYFIDSAEAAIYQRIRETAGVNRITEFSTTFDPDTRKLRIEVTLDTVYGEVKVNA